jgi:tetratricopeptide (TPR) repeat protein
MPPIPRRVSVVAVGLVVAALGSAGPRAEAAVRSAAGNNDKIPVTTRSPEARKEFLEGRSLAERLRAQEAIPHLDKAISLDPQFALAELARANAAQTAKEFFEHLQKAARLSTTVSEGERLLILAAEAGGTGNPSKQKQYLEQLVTAHPGDERAHFTLGGFYFGQQDLPKAIEHYRKAIELAPDYSPAYNILGYAYRQSGDYTSAEQAFKKYVDLIPGDPNPYDSYAELLLKMGRFDESIARYRQALEIDAHFVASRVGIAANLMYTGKHAAALSETAKIAQLARSDGERRTALFTATVVHVDAGRTADALAEMDKQFALGQKANDAAAMAGDLQFKGNILLEAGRTDEAAALFDRLLSATEGSNLPADVKRNARLFHHYNLGRVALAKKDLAAAAREADALREGASALGNPNLVRQAHELAGATALEAGKHAEAIAQLQQANLQDPYNLYRLALAHKGAGDRAKAQEFAAKAAGFNGLPQLNYAFVRAKAGELAGPTR